MKPSATPGSTAWLSASPTRLNRRKVNSTPSGAAPSDSASTATRARRMKANSRKGPATISTIIACPCEMASAPSTCCVSPQASSRRASSTACGKCARTWAWSCSTATTVRPCRCHSWINDSSKVVVAASMALNGSSSSSSSASCTIRRANSRRWNWPADSAPMGRCASCAMPTAARAWSTRACRSAGTRASRPKRCQAPSSTQSRASMGKPRSISHCCGR